MNAQRTPDRGHAVVIGGGISGLAAAHRLLADGARVTVLEASQRLGGKLHAGEIAGVPVDLGAESMLARRPEAVELARAVGLADRLRPPATTSANLWTRGGLRPMPKGHVMGVPGGPEPLAASGVLSEEGLAGVAREPQLPPLELSEDVSIGDFVASRFGREVVDRLVEPLLGGVYAGDAYQISLRAAVPQLFEEARTHASLTETVRAIQQRGTSAQQPGGPVFMGIDGGVGQLPPAVAEAVRAAGGLIRTGTPVRGLRPGTRPGDAWTVVLDDEVLTADAVVLAVPAPAAARLLADWLPAAAAELNTVDYASMALVTMAFRRAEVAGLPDGSGFLVPSVDGRRIKASTFCSRKWGWVRDADPELFVLRTSIGRYQDEADLKREDAELVEISLADLQAAVGLAARPVATEVTRWIDGLPQYPVGHLDRIARIRTQVDAVPGLAVCGAAYDGVGIPACVASGRNAAGRLLPTLAPAVAQGE
ncbi:protoporphyrinogen oxidase [Streptomyces palmae]|uniref:Coproporphyrinogen III oxidase n=1 Tax=Streptomyces palmae TaxID=1701085 RepID=A0A4Z0H9V4_9ACTN|nr:protoporphyrinogen oxidase [Streptomyces palmae]TGB14436.1 protoporphyrinogen oxidase [Streptomyces palmae]